MKPFAAAIVMEYLRATSLKAGVILVYHEIAERQGDPSAEIVPPVGRDVFARQIDHLKRRYRVVRAADIVEAVQGRRRGQRFPVAITFDDDLASHTRVAAPVLREAGVHATFFLSGASLERPYRFWWERLQAAADEGFDVHEVAGVADSSTDLLGVATVVERMPAAARGIVAARLEEALGADPDDAGMRSADVAELVQAGFGVGFHTRSHHLLPGLPDEDLRKALRSGREELAAAAGEPVDLIAYPYGKADERVARAAEAEGYRFGYTGTRHAISPQTDPFLLDRMGPSFVGLAAFAFDLVRALAREAKRQA